MTRAEANNLLFILGMPLVVALAVLISEPAGGRVRDLFGDPPQTHKTFTEVMGHAPFEVYVVPFRTSAKEISK